MLSITNLYIGLKAGWGFGVAITACILSYAIWTALHRLGLARTPMTILENNCMQSTASSAGYSTGGTLVSAFAAWMLINGAAMPLGEMLAWVFLLAVRKTLDDWPEKGHRRIKWVSPATAGRLLREPLLQRLCRQLEVG